MQTVQQFAAQLVESLSAAGTFIAERLQFEADPEHAGGIKASFSLHGGTFTVRVMAADQWVEGAAVGQPVAAVNWSHASNGAFTCGTYTSNPLKVFWDVAAAVSFSTHAGDVPFEDDF